MFFVTAGIVFALLLVLYPVPALIGFIASSSLFYVSASLYKFKLTYNSLGHQYEIGVDDEEVAAMDERDLPNYSILVPLYREAAVLPRLVSGIGGIDYPKTKLDVRLLCEEDDDETVPGDVAVMWSAWAVNTYVTVCCTYASKRLALNLRSLSTLPSSRSLPKAQPNI